MLSRAWLHVVVMVTVYDERERGKEQPPNWVWGKAEKERMLQEPFLIYAQRVTSRQGTLCGHICEKSRLHHQGVPRADRQRTAALAWQALASVSHVTFREHVRVPSLSVPVFSYLCGFLVYKA